MSDDIVKRLLDWKTRPASEEAQLYFDAAQEIERLREENRKLRDAARLKQFLFCRDNVYVV